MAQQTPDLASILNALRASPSSHPPPQPTQTNIYISQPQPQPTPPPKPSQLPPPTGPDPRAITTWAPALRHVTRLLSRSQATVDRVRKLMQSQRDHEVQWWEGRQALLRQQRERGEGRKRIEGILKSVGGHVDSSIQGPTPEEDVAELARYDAKVHRALMEMEKAFRAELSGTGIPFFGTSPGLVVRGSAGGLKDLGTGDGGEEGTISEDRLKEMQRRMVKLLEDLCGD